MGPSGKSIFLPAAGYRYLVGYLGNGATGYYATASLHATNPCYAVYTSFTSGNVVGDNNIYRYYGLTVRPVAD